jgi:hypothetical protein
MHKVEDLLDAVGVVWREDSQLHAWDNGLTSTCLYTGPALGTQELDAMLLVAGFKHVRERNAEEYTYAVAAAIYKADESVERSNLWPFEWLIMYCNTPGHALASAIQEVG